jgi:two-component system, response regulator PdtaR
MAYQSSHPAAVLVVEDEPLIRMVAVDMIADAGFSAFEAADAAQAIACLKEHKEISILFTDVNMPGMMDGVALAHYVRDRWPGVKIVVTTGRRSLGDGELPPECAMLPKPYRLSHLIGMLHELSAAATECAG